MNLGNKRLTHVRYLVPHFAIASLDLRTECVTMANYEQDECKRNDLKIPKFQPFFRKSASPDEVQINLLGAKRCLRHNFADGFKLRSFPI